MGQFRLLLSEPRRVNFRQQPRNFVHRHTFFEPCLVVAGHGEFHHGDDRFPLRAGDLFVADPGVYHEITSLRARDLDLLFTSFQVTEVTACSEPTPAADRLVQLFLRQHVVWRRAASALVTYLDWLHRLNNESGLRSRTFLLEEAMRLFVWQVMGALTVDAPQELPAAQVAQQRLSRVLRAIDAHLDEPVYVAAIARASGLSERSLRRMVRHELGRTVTAEIQERKIQRAAALLALPEFNVAEAGRQVGIEDQAQFSRLFRKVMGVSPRNYRQATIPPARGRTRFSAIGGVAMKTEFRDASAARIAGILRPRGGKLR